MEDEYCLNSNSSVDFNYGCLSIYVLCLNNILFHMLDKAYSFNTANRDPA